MSNLQKLNEPKIFISYSWTTPEHEEWVLELATRLTHAGIQVELDKWALKEGQDIYVFMESMVNSKDIDKVLIICDKAYMEKAEGRMGGVGTEAQIITHKVYADTKQEKFIPIVSERDDKNDHYIPTFMASRLYIDLSSAESFEENLEKLIRNLYQVPLYKKPTLGKPPQYLTQEEEVPTFQTGLILRKMNITVERNPKKLKYIWGEFCQSYFESLDSFVIKDIPHGLVIHEIITAKIEQMLPLRNDYVAALEILCVNEEMTVDNVVEFFEEIYRYTEFKGNGSYYDTQFDHFKFLITELFILTASALIKFKKYKELHQLLNAQFLVESKEKHDTTLDYKVFRYHLASLEQRNQELKLNRASVHADMLNHRISSAEQQKNLLEADLFLYFCSKANINPDGFDYTWFPTTYVYYTKNQMRIIRKLKSKRHFDDIKSLLNMQSIEELRAFVHNFKTGRGYANAVTSTIPSIGQYIKPEEIGTIL